MELRYFYLEYFVAIFLLCVSEHLCFFEDDYDDTPSFGRCPWIRNKLKNGRVKLRSRGRIAKFLCDPGYELAGKRFATCVRGQWNNPIPVCVARGCSRVPMVANGRVTEMYRGALLVYDCNPGYTLDGVVSIYCDGRRWSTDPPSCVVTTSEPETTCDFEDPDLCGWNHDPTHDFDWKRNQFSTPSGHVGTGPSYDHTFGPGKGGFYLYLEASSPRKVNDTSRLFSPVYPPDYSGGCFIFWYHMYGATTGGLRVYIKRESHVFGEVHASWEMFGDQGNEWRRGSITIPVLEENFQIVIEGIRGTSYVGDTAIDDVKLTRNDCQSVENTTEPVAHTVAESCRGRCREPEDETSCGCNENCFAYENCCNDYATICTTASMNDTSAENPDEPSDFDLGKTSSPVTVTISKEVFFENESPKGTDSTHSFSLSSKFTSETAAELVTTELTLGTTKLIEIPTVTQASPKSSSVIPRTERTHTTFVSTNPSTSTTTSTKSTTVTIPTQTTTETTSIKTLPITSTSFSSSTTNHTQTPSTVLSSSTKLSTTSPLPSTILSSITPNTTEKFTEPFISNYYFNISSSSTASSTTSSTLSTRKTYNLRPRSTTLVFSSSVRSTQTSFESTATPERTQMNSSESKNMSYLSSSTASYPGSTLPTIAVNSSESKLYTTDLTKWYNTTVFAVFTTRRTTSKSTETPSTSSTKASTKISSLRPTTSSISRTTKIAYVPITTKNEYFTFNPTEKLLIPVSSESYENHASKLESLNSSKPPTVTIISVVVVSIICVAGGLFYYLKKQKTKRQSKLSDDSEMKFLSENEIMEYSDASALDKILIK